MSFLPTHFISNYKWASINSDSLEDVLTTIKSIFDDELSLLADLLHDGVDCVGVDDGEGGEDCAGEGTGQAYTDRPPRLVQTNHTESSHSLLL